MKTYVKIKEARQLCLLDGWMLRGILVTQEVPVGGKEVLDYLEGREAGKSGIGKKARCWNANGRYVVYRSEDPSKFYELVI